MFNPFYAPLPAIGWLGPAARFIRIAGRYVRRPYAGRINKLPGVFIGFGTGLPAPARPLDTQLMVT